MIRSAREAVVKQWESELAWYQSAPLVFPSDARKREFFEQAERALVELRRPLLNAAASLAPARGIEQRSTEDLRASIRARKHH